MATSTHGPPWVLVRTVHMSRRIHPLLLSSSVALLLSAHCVDSTPPNTSSSSSGSGGGGGIDLSGCANGLCAPYTCDEYFGICRTTCASSFECIDGFVCEAGFCIGTECNAENAASVCGAYSCVKGICEHDCEAAPCAPGHYCRGDKNECVPYCTSRADPICDGYLCDTEVGECEPICVDGQLPCAAGYACSSELTCLPDTGAPPCNIGCGLYVCVEQFDRCATHCVSDSDCSSPAICTNGQCAL